MKLLLVEDDARTAQAVARGLREDEYVVDVAVSAEDGEAHVDDANCRNVNYRSMIVDWYLRGKDGVAMCRAASAACHDAYPHAHRARPRSRSKMLSNSTSQAP